MVVGSVFLQSSEAAIASKLAFTVGFCDSFELHL